MGVKKIKWCSASGGEKAKDAVKAGVDGDDKLYVARATHEGRTTPGKLHMGHTHVYIPYNGAEVPVEEYEVLCAPSASLSWVDSANGEVPDHAVEGGEDDGGEKIYIGRAMHNGTVTVGKVHPSHGCCYIAYGGEEHSYTEYEILVKNALGRFMGV